MSDSSADCDSHAYACDACVLTCSVCLRRCAPVCGLAARRCPTDGSLFGPRTHMHAPHAPECMQRACQTFVCTGPRQLKCNVCLCVRHVVAWPSQKKIVLFTFTTIRMSCACERMHAQLRCIPDTREAPLAHRRSAAALHEVEWGLGTPLPSRRGHSTNEAGGGVSACARHVSVQGFGPLCRPGRLHFSVQGSLAPRPLYSRAFSLSVIFRARVRCVVGGL